MRYPSIDEAVRELDASTPDSLARLLTKGLATDVEKTRAIFSWIAQHIRYNTGIYSRSPRNARFDFDPSDTFSIWRSGNEMTAYRVLYRRTAVCEGYARLFKTLCDYAGLQSELISGYARCGMDSRAKFRTNHTWNAVRIDSSWQLLDVTWGSGYMNFANQYVQQIDETYFLPDPARFIHDHYPEDLRWTLLSLPPALREFQQGPFLCRAFIKYGIQSISPAKGTIDASPGDTVRIILQLNDPEKNRSIASDAFFDSAMLTASANMVFLEPECSGKTAVYSYVVPPQPVEWLQLLYNQDLIMRYRLKVKEAR